MIACLNYQQGSCSLNQTTVQETCCRLRFHRRRSRRDAQIELKRHGGCLIMKFMAENPQFSLNFQTSSSQGEN